MLPKANTTEEQIMDAAYSVFIEKGYDNAKMQHIADKAGIKRTALNYYFRSKDSLYRQTSKRIIHQALPNLLKILNSELPFEKKVSDFVESYITLAMKNPFLQLFIINEIYKVEMTIDRMVEEFKPEIHNFLKQIEQEIAKGKILNINPIQIHLHLISLCIFPIVAKPMMMFITNMNENQYKSIIEERKNEITRLFLKGIKP
ncbi:TetR/AcrR family transcriptional regulator [Flavobacterium wongokense]|uniref:TetR/AcrR family transcriptional regulator n=1 Tax=Flavobacterium wongokense TaxID=2910674 RepID=UPI001F331BD5|nr:TetR/AcrR family transcriptional regulator [Flavobacterium sp. WG47]MCF6132525.1 TetR/AcrR family transcriptional regulator [Flavobacterium sp. WG47]